MCQGKQKYNEHVQTLAELHMIPHLYVSKPIHFLLHCHFNFDFQLPSLFTGIAKSHLATNTLPSFMTWKTAIASLDHKFPLSCLSLMSVVTLCLQGLPALFPLEKYSLLAFSVSKNSSWLPSAPQLPPALSNGLNLERDIEISKKVWKRFVGWLMWTHCAPSERQLKLTVQLEPWWKSTLIDETQRPLKRNTDHSWCQLNSLQH